MLRDFMTIFTYIYFVFSFIFLYLRLYVDIPCKSSARHRQTIYIKYKNNIRKDALVML